VVQLAPLSPNWHNTAAVVMKTLDWTLIVTLLRQLFSFVLSRKLTFGDCGSLLYVEEDGVFQPVGMLVGEIVNTRQCFGFKQPVYQAIVLSQAFKDIECDYKHQVTDIRLFTRSEYCSLLRNGSFDDHNLELVLRDFQQETLV